METATLIDLDAMSAPLVEMAHMAGRVPVSWMWGPDVRAAHSAWLDTLDAKLVLVFDPTFQGFTDGRICEFAGLPAFPMQGNGVALRTVAKQIETGFD